MFEAESIGEMCASQLFKREAASYPAEADISTPLRGSIYDAGRGCKDFYYIYHQSSSDDRVRLIIEY